MTDRDIEVRFAKAVKSAAPDILDELLAHLPPQDQAGGAGSQGDGKVIDIDTVKKKKPRWGRYFATLAAALILAVGLFTFSRYRAYATVDSLIGLDVNPSVELGINKMERVVYASALNADGEAIIGGMDLRGTDLDVAVNALIGSMLTNGYITDLANSVLVSVANDDPAAAAELQQRVSAEIESLLSVTSSGGAVLSQTVTSGGSLEDIASQYGISQGKAALIEEILASSVTYTSQELAAMSINELALLLSNPSIAVEGVQSTGQASDKAYIGSDMAAQAAFDHAGVTQADVMGLEVEFDHDDGIMVYDVEFYAGGSEYEYEIDASTGAIVEYSSEAGHDWTPPSQDAAQGQTSQEWQLTPQEALDIALQHAGISRESADVDKSELDWDDGVLTYEVEFKSGGYEYEYVIDAASGAVLEHDREWD